MNCSEMTYLQRARKLSSLRSSGKISDWELVAFVLHTANQRYETAVRLWQRWMKGYTDRPLWGRKYIELLPEANWFSRSVDEGTAAWIARLRGIKGLGQAKGPFLACLMEPLNEEVEVCLDVWMQLGLGFEHRQRMHVGDFRLGQALIRSRALSAGLPPFVYQWKMWDELRGEKTDIGEDLIGGLA